MAGGNGCYECCVPVTNGPGYQFCSEVMGANGPIDNCSVPQSWFPPWWPDGDPNNVGYGDAGLPPNSVPVESWGDDDGSGSDPGASIGGDDGGGGGTRRPPAYQAPLRYALPPGPHQPYRP